MPKGLTPVGDEFRVNTYTDDWQYRSIATTLGDGSFVVTWTSKGTQDGSGSGIYGQRYTATGAAVGAEFQVNTYTDDMQYASNVTALNDGGFVVTWTSKGAQDGSVGGVYGQGYDATGAAVGAEFQVNTYTFGWQSDASVTALGDGGFVVIWQSYGQDGSSYGIRGQRYDAASAAVEGEFQVNTYTQSRQEYPSSTALDDGGFMVIWQSLGQGGDNYGVYGQRYDATGAAVGAEFQVNTHTDNDQLRPNVTTLGDGGFVAIWQSLGQDGSNYGIYGQRYDAAGTTVGAEFQVNTHTDNDQLRPNVTALGDGGFVVVWESVGQDGSSSGVYGQRYDAAGATVADEFRVNAHTDYKQSSANATALDDGSILVTWESYNQDGSSSDVYAQRFSTQITANSDDDRIEGSDGRELFRGGDGNDLLLGRGGDDVLAGNADNDRLYGGADNDKLYGGTGNDNLNGGSGDDFLHGGLGNDLLRGNNGNDMLYGSSGTDVLAGNAGDDVLRGGYGNDKLYGGIGNDNLDGSWGNDRIYGGLGNDILRGGEGEDTLYGRAGNDVLSGGYRGDRLYGGDDDDRLYGGGGDDTLNGDAGNDFIDGGYHDDILNGGDGDDLLLGQADDDTLSGGNGADRLYGGLGDDSLTGNSGADTFVFEAIAGTDTVQDFEDGIDLVRFAGEFTDLTVAAAGSDVDITSVDGGHMLLLSTDLADITEADFVFV